MVGCAFHAPHRTAEGDITRWMGWEGEGGGIGTEDIYIYIYTNMAAASAADLWDLRHGCLDAWILVFLLAW